MSAQGDLWRRRLHREKDGAERDRRSRLEQSAAERADALEQHHAARADALLERDATDVQIVDAGSLLDTARAARAALAAESSDGEPLPAPPDRRTATPPDRRTATPPAAPDRS